MGELVINENKMSNNVMLPWRTVTYLCKMILGCKRVKCLSNNNNHHEIMVFNGVHKQSRQSVTV